MGVQQQRSAQHSTPGPVAFDRSFDTLVGLVDRLDAAIRIEEREVARAGGAQFRVRHAERCEGVGKLHQYRLTLDGSSPHLKLQGDITVLQSGRPVASGRVVRSQGQDIWIAVGCLLHDLRGLVLRSEVDWLWAALRRRLRVLWPKEGRRPGGAITPSDALIVDALNARGGRRMNPIPSMTPPQDLNGEQRNAVRGILTNTVTFLWGPPGTGKTRTLAAAVAELVRAERSVLVVAPSNAAADVAAGKIAERLSSHPAFDRGLVVRHGSGAGRRLRSWWGNRLIPAEVAERLEREAVYTSGDDPERLAARAHALEKSLEGLCPPKGQVVCAMLRETGRRVVRRLRLRARASASPKAPRVDRPRITRNARVVVTTVHQLSFDSPVSRMFDTVIIDEAGQASLPLVMLAAGHAREAIVLAGDPRQLQPAVQSQDEKAKRLLAEDVFALSTATSQTGSEVTCMLVEQHRMAAEISHLVSTVWYGGVLRPHPSIVKRPMHPLSRYYGSLLFLDTSCLCTRVIRTKGHSRENRAHVEVIRKVVARFSLTGLLPSYTTVLITSPFKDQTIRLARTLRRFTVSTVHSAQGWEADVVIVDLTDAPGAAVSQFLAAKDIRDEGGRLLNVASSRARHALIVVADFDHLETEGGHVVREFLRCLRDRGKQIPYPVSPQWAESPTRSCARRRVG